MNYEQAMEKLQKYGQTQLLRFYDELGTAMECKWLDDSKDTEHEGVTVKGGRLYEFKPVDFVPGGMTILSEADWLYIAEQINDGNDAWKKLYLDSETNSCPAERAGLQEVYSHEKSIRSVPLSGTACNLCRRAVRCGRHPAGN